MLGKDDWCWEQSSIEVDVGIEDVHGIEFIQKGYWVNVISTHDVDAYLSQMNGSPMNLKIKVSSSSSFEILFYFLWVSQARHCN